MLKTNTKHATSTLPSLTQKLSKLDLEALAVETGLIERVSPKFSAEGFLLSLLQCVCLGKGSLQNIAQNLSQIQHEGLSKQAIDYRFKKNRREALLFFEAVSEALLKESQQALLEHKHFGRVLLQDSSQLRLPKSNAKHYKGISNQYGEKSSAKLDIIKDALSGEVMHSSIHDGTYQDRNLAKDLYALVLPHDLVLRDMGYFSTAGLAEIDSKGASYVSRVPNNTKITLLNGTSLEQYLKTVPRAQNIIDLTVHLTNKSSLKTRLVALRCSEEVTTQRRAKAKAHHVKMGNKKTMYTIDREGWTIYVTNLEREEFSAPIIHELYAQRWGIEIQFRALKSQADLYGLLDKKVKHKVHLEILLQVIMILAQLTAKLHHSFKKSLSKKEGASLSIERISSCLVSSILKLTSLQDTIYFDLRHLSYGKKRKKTHLNIKASSLF